MGSWLRLGGLALAGIVGLWIVLEVVSVVFGIVSWLVSTVLTLLVLALLIYLGYLAFTKLPGGSSGSNARSQSRSRVR